VAVLALANLAYADDLRGVRRRTADVGVRPGEARGLTFMVRTAGAPVMLEAELLLRGGVIMSERRSLRAEADRVELFSRGAEHFAGLRVEDAASPGRVRVRIRQNGELIVEASLTEFEAKYAAPAPRPRRVAATGQCEDNCAFLYDDCSQTCDPQGQGCENCWRYYQDCVAACPDCDDWEEVSRTLLRRRFSGGSNILGHKYCNFEEYYLVEETNPAGCYPNRFVCDYDDDSIFEGWGSSSPDEGDCCNDNVGPGDENYCGGTDTTCG
jgi:hypothetical protein